MRALRRFGQELRAKFRQWESGGESREHVSVSNQSAQRAKVQTVLHKITGQNMLAPGEECTRKPNGVCGV